MENLTANLKSCISFVTDQYLMHSCCIIAASKTNTHTLINVLEGVYNLSVIHYKNSKTAILKSTEIPQVLFFYQTGESINEKEWIQLQYAFPTTSIIIISPFKVHAYEVLKHNYADFLLFPFKREELESCMDKILQEQKNNKNRLCIHSYKDYKFVRLKDILFLRADNNNTEFYLRKKKVHGFKTLKIYQNRLPSNFVRIHKSYMVNSDKVWRIHFGKRVCEVIGYQHPLPFSKSYLENMHRLNQTISKTCC